MPRVERASLWNAIHAGRNASGRFLAGAGQTLPLNDLAWGSSLAGGETLRGRSVLIAVEDPFAAALALIELDGVARRLVLCPPDLASEHLPFVMAAAEVDAAVSDGAALPGENACAGPCVRGGTGMAYAAWDRGAERETEWILLTSGTTGRPKLVAHTLASLAGAIGSGGEAAGPAVWSTFYDIRRYGGLQIFLRAILAGGSLVLSSAREATDDFLTRAGALGVTHISGTPTHWRRALMTPAASRLDPRYVRLSGEIADQAILDHLHAFYPQAAVAHAFASTEAGVAFDVRDGLAGFPASLLEQRNADVEMKVEDGSLRIRSPRTAAGYLGSQAALAGADGFVDTGDMLELLGGRYYFVGRRDGVINVGGLKVHPEEVEGVINRHPRVRQSLVRAKGNPITGSLVVADVVLDSEPGAEPKKGGPVEHEILQLCRGALARHKVPAAIRLVGELPMAATGKMVRRHA